MGKVQGCNQVTMAEWLRRQTRNLLGEPAQVRILLATFFYRKKKQGQWLLKLQMSILFDVEYLFEVYIFYIMELKKQLLLWYNTQLQQKNMFISSLQDLSTAYYFMEVLHCFHPKTVDLTKVYVKPKNQYEVLQNYKQLSSCFVRLGWKKFDAERYSKKKQKDYLSLAQILRKILSTRSLKQSHLQNNIDTTLDQFKNEQEIKASPPHPIQKSNMKIIKLEQNKSDLLNKIVRIQEELSKQYQGKNDQQLIEALKAKIELIINTPNQLN